MPLLIFADHNTGIIQKMGVKRRDRTPPGAGDWQEEPYDITMGEHALWRAVILQAIVDATQRTRKPDLLMHKMEALRWLAGNSDDFIDVCERADMDINLVRVRAKKALANPHTWRIEAGESQRYEYKKQLRERKRRARALARVEQIPPLSGCLILNLHA